MSWFVGSVLGGPGLRDSRFCRMLARVASAAREPEAVAENEGTIDLVFHVPGSVKRPEYEGIRTGRFSRKERILSVQVAVPDDVLLESCPERFILAAMKESIGVAAPAFKKTRIPFSVREHLALLESIERAVARSETWSP